MQHLKKKKTLKKNKESTWERKTENELESAWDDPEYWTSMRAAKAVWQSMHDRKYQCQFRVTTSWKIKFLAEKISIPLKAKPRQNKVHFLFEFDIHVLNYSSCLTPFKY